MQLFLLLEQRGARYALAKALLASQGLFGLVHIPFQLETWGSTWSELPLWLLATGVMGVIFALFYIKTQNLFIAVGFHALFNAPTQLFAPPVADSRVLLALVTFLGLTLILLPQLGRFWQPATSQPAVELP